MAEEIVVWAVPFAERAGGVMRFAAVPGSDGVARMHAAAVYLIYDLLVPVGGFVGCWLCAGCVSLVPFADGKLA